MTEIERQANDAVKQYWREVKWMEIAWLAVCLVSVFIGDGVGFFRTVARSAVAFLALNLVVVCPSGYDLHRSCRDGEITNVICDNLNVGEKESHDGSTFVRYSLALSKLHHALIVFIVSLALGILIAK